ncbi:formylglycine-generating enzyme family protein [Methylomagnum sp.]
MLTCLHCQKSLGWQVEYCPYCGEPQVSQKIPSSTLENSKTTPERPEQSDSLLKPIPQLQPIAESISTLTPGTNPATPEKIPDPPELEQKTRSHNTAIIVILVLLVATLSVTILGDNRDTQKSTQNDHKTDSSNIPSNTPPPPIITPIIPEMVLIKGGYFEMGSPENEIGRGQDERLHRVRVNSFYMGKYEVSFDEYDRFAKDTHRPLPRDDEHGRGRRPVFRISWIDAYEYAAWLSAKTGKPYRLPREAEWEYAARLGSTVADSTPNKSQTCLVMNHMDCKDSPKRAVRVGTRQPNSLGLYDMFGNIAELTGSAYDADYNGGELALVTPENGSVRVMRGGSWAHQPSSLRVANRDKTTVDMTHNTLGFRLALDP